MLHLLPEEQKQYVLTEYRKRLFVMVCLFAIMLAVIGIVSLVPSYVYSYTRYESIQRAKDTLDKNISTQQGDQTAAIVKRINEDITALQPLGAKDSPSTVFDRLISYADSSIHLTEFTYTRSKDNTLAAVLVGRANDRDSLTNFIKTLQQDNYFSGVDVPLSSFTKEKDIQFSLNMVVKGSSTSSMSVTK